MEENILEKKETEAISNNNNLNKNGIIAILVVIIIALIGVVIYFAFIKKDEPTTDNNGGNSTPTPTVEPTTNGVSKKIVFNSCNNVVESFNGVKVEVKNAKAENDAIGCEGEIFVNNSKITEFDEQGIDSIEIYDTYVIIDGRTSGGGLFIIYDTKNNNQKIIPDLGKYFQEQDYVSDDEGLTVIASSHAGEYGAPEPEHAFRKLRIKYTNGSFGTPEIIEEYDEYRELVK